MKVNEVLNPLVGFEDGEYWLQHGTSSRLIETKNVGKNLEITFKAYVITINADGEIINSRIEIPSKAKIYSECTEEYLEHGMGNFKEFVCRNNIIISAN